MAVRYAVASGNWSNTAIWNGGTLPTLSDDVYANTFTVAIDQDVTIRSLQNVSTTGVTAGGTFTCAIAATIDCSAASLGTPASSTTLLSITNGVGTTVLLKSNLYGHNNSALTLSFTGLGTLNIVGNIYSIQNGGATANAVFSSTGTVNITGDILYSSVMPAIRINGANTVNITGNVYSNISLGATCTLSITGNLNSSSTTPISAGATSTIITVVGSFIGGGQACFNSSSASTLIATGPIYSGPTGIFPIQSSGIVKLTGITNNEMRFVKSSGGTISLYSPDVVSGTPAAANVRAGTVYGGGSLTGTCSIPAAASVSYGVPVGNTTGTAVLQPKDIAAVVGAQIAAVMSTV